MICRIATAHEHVHADIVRRHLSLFVSCLVASLILQDSHAPQRKTKQNGRASLSLSFHPNARRTPSYASINMAPLLARPGSTSERWHVLSNPDEDGTAAAADSRNRGGAVAGAAPSASASSSAASSPSSSAGTILLSLGFTPSGGGTPSVRPLSLSATLLGSAGKPPRHFSAEPSTGSGSGSGNGSANRSGGGGRGDSGLEEQRRTPREGGAAKPKPEGFSLGEAAVPASASVSVSPGDAGVGGGRGVERVDPTAPKGMVDARQRSAISNGTSGRRTGGGGGGGGGGESSVRNSTAAGALDVNGTGTGTGGDAGDGRKRGASVPEALVSDDAGSPQQGVEKFEMDGEVVVDEEEEEAAEEEGMVHLFRVKSYSAPVWCEICQRLLLGVSRRCHPSPTSVGKGATAAVGIGLGLGFGSYRKAQFDR